MTGDFNRFGHALFLAVVLGAAAGLAWPLAVEAQSLGNLAETAAEDLEQGTDLIEIIFYLGGVVLIGVGIMKFRDLSQGRGSFSTAMGITLVGAGLILVPAVFDALVASFGADEGATIDRPTLN